MVKMTRKGESEREKENSKKEIKKPKKPKKFSENFHSCPFWFQIFANQILDQHFMNPM